MRRLWFEWVCLGCALALCVSGCGGDDGAGEPAGCAPDCAIAQAGTGMAPAGQGAAGTPAASTGGTGAAGIGGGGAGVAGTGGAGGTVGGGGGTAPGGSGGTTGTGGMSAGSDAGDSGTGGSMSDAGMAGATGGTGGMPSGACTGPALPPVSDYGARGPFDVMTVNDTGPSSQYTMFRPRTLGENGFLHPPTTWGNGVSTTPSLYTELLSTVASHGFVVIASNSTSITAQQVRQGLEWLIEQNTASGDFQGKLATDCAVAIGYSMGGGAAVGAAAHPNVIATVSLHGLTGASDALNGPLLLITSTDDGFVTKSGFVMPTYTRSSKVPTIMATLNNPGTPSFAGHLIPLGDAGPERAPLVAWLRLFVYGDQGARGWFYGSDCTLCKEPWTDIQKKNGDWD